MVCQMFQELTWAIEACLEKISLILSEVDQTLLGDISGRRVRFFRGFNIYDSL